MNIIKDKKMFGVIEGQELDYREYRNLGFGISKIFARPLGVTLTSILENNMDEKFIFHIFIEELEDKDFERFELLAKKYKQIIIFYYVNSLVFDKVITSDEVWKATYYRLIGAEQLRDKADYLFWLDSDIICCGSLEKIFNMKLDDKLAAVVLHAKQKMVDKRIKGLNLESGKYFNAGIIYININNWNKFEANKKIMQMIANPLPEWEIYDQDMLNVLIDGKYEILPYIYNFQRLGGSEEYRKIPQDIKIYHYIGRAKPWLNYKSEFQDKWLEYWKISCWNDVPLEEVQFESKNATKFRYISKAFFKDGQIINGIKSYTKYLYLKFNR